MFIKIRNIVIVIILLVSTTGVTLSKHYSGDKLFSIALFGDAESCCDGPCDCCNDTVETVKVSDCFFKSDFHFDTTENPIDLFYSVNYLVNNLFNTEYNGLLSDNYNILKHPGVKTTAFLQCFRL